MPKVAQFPTSLGAAFSVCICAIIFYLAGLMSQHRRQLIHRPLSLRNAGFNPLLNRAR